MRKGLVLGATLALMVACTLAQSCDKKECPKSKGWITDFEEAKKEAAESKRPVFAFFTGSDWCGWCVKLKKEVLDTAEFAKFAGCNLVLFEADFPRKTKLPEATKRQNEVLANKFGVRGFPTIYMLDAEGKSFGQVGYRAGGPVAYIQHLTEMMKEGGYKDACQAACPQSATCEKTAACATVCTEVKEKKACCAK